MVCCIYMVCVEMCVYRSVEGVCACDMVFWVWLCGIAWGM